MMRLVRIIKNVTKILTVLLALYFFYLNFRGIQKQNFEERRIHRVFSEHFSNFNEKSPEGEQIEKNSLADTAQKQRQKGSDESNKRNSVEGSITLQSLDTNKHRHHDRKKRTTTPEPEMVSNPPLLFGEDGVGLLGEEVEEEAETLTDYDQQRYDQGYRLHNFNVFASDMISVDRSLEDTRNPLCLTQKYPADLPDTSVIMCFLNEAWSVLVRSVHSVINTSPPHLLREIILVDDHSDYDYLKGPLDKHMKRFPKVKILRNEKREGLARSRLAGARHAKGKVLTFLDSRIECLNGWLPPLLARIRENTSHVVTPLIPNIHADSFEAKLRNHTGKFATGTFSWDLELGWDIIKPEDDVDRPSVISPLKSPTMAGGMFSIDKENFYKMGAYDEGMEFWGGENLEMSFRIWMCGGSLEIIPCSVVFHIFRQNIPNKTPMNERSIDRNKLRMANVWMDDYKHIYLRYTRRTNDKELYGDIGPRLELKKALKCHNFKWYIDNIYPNIFLPSKALQKGKLRNMGDVNLCLTAPKKKTGMLYVATCEPIPQQLFYRTTFDEFRQLVMCVDVGGDYPEMAPCHHGRDGQELVYTDEGKFYNPALDQYLTLDSSDDNLYLHKMDDEFQEWEWVSYMFTA